MLKITTNRHRDNEVASKSSKYSTRNIKSRLVDQERIGDFKKECKPAFSK